MRIEAEVGPQVLADGAFTAPRLDRTGASVVSQYMARYAEAVKRGQVFLASNVAAQAVSVALATTYTGLCISNPIASGKNVILLGGQYALSVAPAAIASLHLIAGYSPSTNVTHTTPLAAPGIQNCLIGSGQACVAKADSAATIVNPGYLLGLGSGFTAAALYATTPLWIDLAGLIVLPPGAWVAWGALTAVTGFATLAWMEENI